MAAVQSRSNPGSGRSYRSAASLLRGVVVVPGAGGWPDVLVEVVSADPEVAVFAEPDGG